MDRTEERRGEEMRKNNFIIKRNILRGGGSNILKPIQSFFYFIF